MIQLRSLPVLAATAFLAVGIGACASGNAAAAAPSPNAYITVDVHNDYPAATAREVMIEPVDGTGVLRVGTVGQGDSRRLDVATLPGDGLYRMVANAVGDQSLESPAFTVRKGTLIEWDLGTNQVTVQDRG